jgi:hypothetical protein
VKTDDLIVVMLLLLSARLAHGWFADVGYWLAIAYAVIAALDSYGDRRRRR